MTFLDRGASMGFSMGFIGLASSPTWITPLLLQIICKFALLPDGCPHGWLIDWTSSQACIATLLLQIVGKFALRMISIAQNTQIMLYLQLG